MGSVFVRVCCLEMSHSGEASAYSKGLAGVNVAESAICTVGVTGVGLNYRGYSIDGMLCSSSLSSTIALLVLLALAPARTPATLNHRRRDRRPPTMTITHQSLLPLF